LGELGFSAYQEQFAAAVVRRGGVIHRLANGGCLAAFGRPEGPRLAVLSGVHGDERSGPLALLSFVTEAPLEDFSPDGPALWMVPLLNDDGWDNNTREWKGVNLNAAFVSDSPVPFVAEVMRDLEARVPRVFLDLHEDSEKPFPYVYRFTEDRQDFSLRLRHALGAEEALWSLADAERWKGSTEIFARKLGCERSATIEAPPAWPMQARIAWNLRAVRQCVAELRRLAGA
jgi:predicted deacylase